MNNKIGRFDFKNQDSQTITEGQEKHLKNIIHIYNQQKPKPATDTSLYFVQ